MGKEPKSFEGNNQAPIHTEILSVKFINTYQFLPKGKEECQEQKAFSVTVREEQHDLMASLQEAEL